MGMSSFTSAFCLLPFAPHSGQRSSQFHQPVTANPQPFRNLHPGPSPCAPPPPHHPGIKHIILPYFGGAFRQWLRMPANQTARHARHVRARSVLSRLPDEQKFQQLWSLADGPLPILPSGMLTHPPVQPGGPAYITCDQTARARSSDHPSCEILCKKDNELTLILN